MQARKGIPMPRSKNRREYRPLKIHYPIDIRKLTNLETLKVCRELWVWISEHPDREKYEWPGWQKYAYDVNCCPCCAKAGYKNGSTPNCQSCLLKKQFQRGRVLVKHLTNFFCENYSDSPWHHYRTVTSIAYQKKWSLKMVEIIDEAIAEPKETQKGKVNV